MEVSLRTLLLGAHGMLGSDLVLSAPQNVVLHTDASSGPRLDITDRAAIERRLDEIEPDVVINAAAYTRVDDAERNRGIAEAVNGTAVGELGVACARRGVRVVQYSTDYVFAGTERRAYREDDLVSPVNAYGRSKRIGEQLLIASGAESLIVRTQWLFGVHGRSFPRTMWERARAGLATRVVSDQWGRPTFTRDLAAATWELIMLDVRGILHVANSGEASWFDLAERVFAAQQAGSLLSPCTTADYPTPARRPGYGVLDTSRFRTVAEYELPHWTDALTRFLALLTD